MQLSCVHGKNGPSRIDMEFGCNESNHVMKKSCGFEYHEITFFLLMVELISRIGHIFFGFKPSLIPIFRCQVDHFLAKNQFGLVKSLFLPG